MPTDGQVPRQARFLVSRMGTCSFCGKRGSEVSAFAGRAGRPHRICGECLGLCLDVTCELDKRRERQALAVQLASFDPGRELRARLAPAIRSGDIDGAIEVLREFGHTDVDPDQLRALLGPRPTDRSCSVGARHPGSTIEDLCSFCDAARADVVRLLQGPGATICDRCIDDASADVLGALVAT